MNLDALTRQMADKVRRTGVSEMVMLELGSPDGDRFTATVVVSPTKPAALVQPVKTMEVVQ